MQIKARKTAVYFICRQCAEDHGGVWPEGHSATCHEGPCQVCGETRSLCAPQDWQLTRLLRPYPVDDGYLWWD